MKWILLILTIILAIDDFSRTRDLTKTRADLVNARQEIVGLEMQIRDLKRRESGPLHLDESHAPPGAAATADTSARTSGKPGAWMWEKRATPLAAPLLEMTDGPQRPRRRR